MTTTAHQTNHVTPDTDCPTPVSTCTSTPETSTKTSRVRSVPVWYKNFLMFKETFYFKKERKNVM